MSRRPKGPLRRGWTTGACATAAAAAAYQALLTGRFPDPVSVALPRGRSVAFSLAREHLGDGAATAGIVKDAGDDPDVTHQALVLATVRLTATAGVTFRAGEGVGTVTLAGLELGVGEPAINPAPRKMMRAAIAVIAEACGGDGNVEIEVAIRDGEKLAERTLNRRLGIVGGLSVLGTTGIVVPFSCASWIASIHRGIDVARAAGITHVAAATGTASAAFVQSFHDLPEVAILDMGDFAGGLLKYLRKHPIARLTVAGGFAKIAKLARGDLDLHSGRSQVDFAWLAGRSGELGANAAVVERMRAAPTARAVLAEAARARLPLADRIAEDARRVAHEVAGETIAIEVLICDREGVLVGRSNG